MSPTRATSPGTPAAKGPGRMRSESEFPAGRPVRSPQAGMLARVAPRLRTIDDDKERHASSLELFFDLVFAVAVAQLGETLVHDTSAAGSAHFAVLFVPVWWAWVGYAFYADRFDTDDVVLRAAMLTAMLGVIWLAIEIPSTFHSPACAAHFAAAYATVRLVLVGLYLRADYHEPRARPLTRRYIAGFSPGAVLWIISVWTPSPARYVLWAIAIVIELTPPLRSSEAFRHVPFHISHIPERFNAFTIIALGETVVLVATGLSTRHLGTAGAVTAILGFLIAAGLWWLYFVFSDATAPAGGRFAPQIYAYGHLLVFGGITAAGVGTLLAIRAARGPLPPGGRGALCGGAAAFLTAITVMQFATAQRWRDRRVLTRLAAAALLLAEAFTFRGLPALADTACAAALFICAIVAEAALDPAASTPSQVRPRLGNAEPSA
jgi:low temperature requirement protein LtrA